MRVQPCFLAVAALVAAGPLNAQHKIGLSFGLGSAWTAIPGRPPGDLLPGLAHGAWGGSATLELSFVSIPHFAVITRVDYAPDRVAPAAPGMLSIGGGLRYKLTASRHVSLRPSLEFEAARFTAVDAYNAVLRPFANLGGNCRFFDVACSFLNYYAEGLLVERRWRLGISLRPALQIWPMERVGFEFTPAVRWLVPVSRSLPEYSHDRYTDPLYLTLGVGMVVKLRG